MTQPSGKRPRVIVHANVFVDTELDRMDPLLLLRADFVVKPRFYLNNGGPTIECDTLEEASGLVTRLAALRLQESAEDKDV